MTWKRPSNIPFPSVWLTFKAKDVDSDNLVEYRVQDLTEEDFEVAFEHMKTYFLKDEVMNNVMGLWKDEDSIKNLHQIWSEMVKQRVSLACFRENSNEMVGCNILYLSENKIEEKLDVFASKFGYVEKTMDFVISQGPNVKELYKVDKHIGAFGLSVDPKYRGRGIATEILKARAPMCKALGIGLTSNVFTGEASQAVARKAGFEENFSISYEELSLHGFDFPNINAKTMKVMSLKVD